VQNPQTMRRTLFWIRVRRGINFLRGSGLSGGTVAFQNRLVPVPVQNYSLQDLAHLRCS